MASREPMWYCHQCNAEMRPLMMPDPVCASCRGSFVEKIEDPADDPREFHQGGPEGELPGGMDPFVTLLHGLMNRSNSGNGLITPPPGHATSPTSGLSFQFSTNSGPGGSTRTIHIGGPRTLGRDAPGSPGRGNVEFGRVPTMSEYIGRGASNTDRDDGGPGITGALMAQYLMAMLGHRGPFPDAFGGDATTQGRMGDYVFNQEALDQIITQLMENSNSSRPVPATEEVVEKLPREVLTEGCDTLEKDCAVCKEQFRLNTEDPDEQIVVTLPCRHPFHEPCIIPWLKSSGTCPVCRHQLVPQPGHENPSPRRDGHDGNSSGSGSSPHSPGRSSASRNNDGGGGGGLLQSLFGMMGGAGNNNNSSSSGRTNSPPTSPNRPSHGRSPSDQHNQRRNSRDNPNHNRYLPGSWDSLD